MTKNSSSMAADFSDFGINDPAAYTLPGIPKVSHQFHLNLINADVNLTQLAQKIFERGGGHAASFCFYGPPGTGKSEFARYMARHLMVPCQMVYASSILHSKVGESEKSLEDIFKHAASRKAVLVFDEADSFLYDRRDARMVWERQLVNEFLRHFDEYPGVIICTTNMVENLDPAVIRRLVFKVGFKELTRAQAADAFTHYFGLPAPQYISQQLNGLTLGDFSLTLKKADILGLMTDADALCRLLYEEVATRHTLRLKRKNHTPSEPSAPTMEGNSS